MAKKSNSQSNTKKIPISKNYDKYYSFREMKEMLIDDAIVEVWAKELKEWAENQTQPVRLNKFYRLKGITWMEFDYLTKKFPILAGARAYAKEVLGDQREMLSITGDGEGAALNWIMPYYCHEWNEIGERKASWNSSNKNDKPTNITIEMQNFSEEGNEKKGLNERRNKDKTK